MTKIETYKFLQELVDKYPSDASPMLMDIIVDYLLFPHGDGSTPDASFSGFYYELEKEVAKMMVDPSQKIAAIKIVKDRLECSLVEAKNYVEQRSWPTGYKNDKALELQLRYVSGVIAKIRKDYNMVEE